MAWLLPYFGRICYQVILVQIIPILSSISSDYRKTVPPDSDSNRVSICVENLRITPTFSRLSTEVLLSMPSAIFPPPCFTLFFKKAFSLDVSVIPETWGIRKSLEAQNWISGFILGSGLRKVTATEYRNPFQNRPLHLFAQSLHEGNTQIPCHIATLHFGNIYSIGLG